MKIWPVFFLILSLSTGLMAQNNDDLENQLDETLTEMQEPAEVLKAPGADVEEPEETADPSIGSKDEGLFDRMIGKMREKFMNQFKQNPLRHMSALEVEKLIRERTQGNMIGDYLAESPRAMYFMVNFMRDEFAIPDLMGIFQKEKELKMYSYFVIGNLIFFFLLGWYYDKKSDSGFLRTILRKIFLALLSTSISIAVFYMIFHKEVRPTVLIAKEAIMKPIAPNPN